MVAFPACKQTGEHKEAISARHREICLGCFELSIFSQTWHRYVHTDSFIYSPYESDEILKQFHGEDSYRRIKISGSVDALLIELDNALIYYLIIKRIEDLTPPQDMTLWQLLH